MSAQLTIEFIDEIQRIADEEFLEYCKRIDKDFPNELGKIAEDFSAKVMDLMQEYGKLQQDSCTGALQWIYISYLRSSIITRKPCFRIDLYDARGQISSTECAAYWEFPLIFQYLETMRVRLEKEFLVQTRVGLYAIDDLILKTADKLFDIALELFPKMIKTALDERFLILPEEVTIMAGEFLDKSIKVGPQ